MVLAAYCLHWGSLDSDQGGCSCGREFGLPNCYVSFPQVVGCWGAVGRHHKALGTWSAALGVVLVVDLVVALVPVTAIADDYGMG